MRLPPALAAALFGIATLAHAQVHAQVQLQPPPAPTPEQLQSMMDASMVSMLPMLARMTELQLETQLKFAARPDTAERIAAFKKNLFDALRGKGFSAEQALQMTNATPLPSAAPAAK